MGMSVTDDLAVNNFLKELKRENQRVFSKSFYKHVFNQMRKLEKSQKQMRITDFL